MSDKTVTIRMDAELERALRSMAATDDITPGQLIRDLVRREIGRRQKARLPVRADERLVAPLRARLAGDLGGASDWGDLSEKLRKKGYALRETGGGLALYDWPDGNRICKASELGFSYSRLMRRFRAPFPGHTHSWLTRRMLSEMGADRNVKSN